MPWDGGEPVASAPESQRVRSIDVPTSKAQLILSITVTDNDGSHATDELQIETVKSVQVEVTHRERRGVCTYYEHAALEQGQPLQCFKKGTNQLIYDRRPRKGPGNIADPVNHPPWSVEWERTALPSQQGLARGKARAEAATALETTIQPSSEKWADDPPTLSDVFEESNLDPPIY